MASTPPDFPGDIRVEVQLGGGRFGETYLVRDAAGRRQVLKVSHDEIDSGLLVRELAVGRVVAHPNLVHVREVRTLSSGRAILLRDWVEGRSLEEIIRDGPLRIRDAFDVVEAVARGVAAMHESGVVHRDVKPSNVLVPYENHRPKFRDAKLSDFGLSAAVDKKLLEPVTPVITHTGVILGTVDYMAPEQLTGAALTPTADVHALGIMLYELIYGHTPFGKLDTVLDTLLNIVHADVALPAKPKLPPAARRLLLRATRRDPLARPATGSDFLEELQFAKQAVADAGLLTLFGVTRDETDSRAGASPLPGRYSFFVGAVLAGVGVVAVVSFDMPTMNMVGVGTTLIGAGVAAASLLRRWFAVRRRSADMAMQVILGVENRKALTRSLAIQVEELVARCERVDQKILGTGLVLQLQEYREAGSFADRQLALKNAMDLVDKLLQRLVPWYTRYERLLTFAVGMLGVAPGVVALVRALGR